jgi:hypothetical protein
VAIVVLGNLFGGSLWGLVPMGACVSTGVWLWMKEVVRSGRELEWSGEQKRGELVCIFRLYFAESGCPQLTKIRYIGSGQLNPGVCGVDEHFVRSHLGPY